MQKPNVRRIQRNTRRLVKNMIVGDYGRTENNLLLPERARLLQAARQQAETFNPKQAWWDITSRHNRGVIWGEKAATMKLKYSAFQNEARLWKLKLSNLSNPKQKDIVTNKSKQIYDIKLRYFDDRYETIKYGIPTRFESLSRVLTELRNPKMLVGQECLLSEPPKKYGEDRYAFSMAFALSRIASDKTDYGGFIGDHKPYTCRLLFNADAFSHEQQLGFHEWGYIKNTPNSAVLGIQIFDPDPRTLYQFTKAMLKIRPNDPIVVFDVYGEVFFP